MKPDFFFNGIALWLLTFALLSGFCYYVFQAFLQWKISLYIKDLPFAKLRSAAQGLIKTQGVAMSNPDESVMTPFGHKPCVWWRISVYTSHQLHSRLIETTCSSTPWILKDKTGECWIDPHHAQIEAAHFNKTVSAHRMTAIGSVKNRHASGILLSWANDFLMYSNEYLYVEEWIAAQDPLLVMGQYTTPKSSGHILSMERLKADTLRRWKQDFPKLLRRFDWNANGKIDADEWALAHKEAEAEVHSMMERKINLPNLHWVKCPSHGLPYLISTKNQLSFNQLAYKRVGWKLFLAFLFLVVCLVMWDYMPKT